MNAKVLLLGVGGLGCTAAQNLVGAGVGKLVLVDDDRVELNNIHRQVLHYENDVGRLKVESAKETLLTINSSCDIDTVARRLEDIELLNYIEQADIVLDCSDNLETRKQVNRLCWQAGTALISGAATRLEGQLLCLVPGRENPCYECFSRLFPEQELSCSEAGVMPPVVSIIGAMQAMEALKLLINLGKTPVGKLLMFDFQTNEWRQFNLVKDPQCSVCGE
ncbi:molybdopterin-synthase adenylyltransferase MoeB [Planctobacterium marinum]|uniref:Molybdopterin-synthase adenylyltransferase MoeB n=2 Tax=Planctobacterium marinum TaxID=1631968 RepID=A0AA48KMX6_9ALTE|nr:molybdopterin-synthase adenylyltransferase MoeB [Planctobacterium marinum]